jgi:hypothetical protein
MLVLWGIPACQIRIPRTFFCVIDVVPGEKRPDGIGLGAGQLSENF